jgi:hypothetical protein
MGIPSRKFSFHSGEMYRLGFINERHLDVTINDFNYPTGSLNHFANTNDGNYPKIYMAT